MTLNLERLKQNKGSDCWQRIAPRLFLLISLLLIALSSSPVFAINLFNYIYVESNEGDSSGGHAALQFDNDIFHYQYTDPGIIRLQKQQTDHFEFDYRFAANRSLHTSQIDVTEETYTLLRDYFNFQYQTQQQQFSLLDDLEKDRGLLKSFLPIKSSQAGTTLRLKGAGLFYKETDFSSSQISKQIVQTGNLSATTIALHEKIIKTYGKDFLAQRTAKIISQIKSLQPTQWQKPIANISLQNHSLFVYSFANRYMDLTTAMLAIQMIEQGLPLVTDAYVEPSAQLFKLSAPEIAALQAYRKKLIKSLIKLVNSNRPDWGVAVLINTARLITIDESIKRGKLIFVNSFDNQTEVTDEIGLDKYTGQLQKHLNDTKIRLLNSKSLLIQKKLITEMNYSQLEMWANRYIELNKAATSKQAIRLYSASRVPRKSIALPLLVIPELPIATIKQSLQQLGIYQKHYLAALKQLYAYNLVTRNCVTELFTSMDKALSRQAGANDMSALNGNSKQHLGGYVDTSLLNFIPVTSHYAVRNNYNITKQILLPSFRLMKLSELYSKENDLLVYLRENNTLSSTLYTHNADDSFFIFFTDNELLLRPLFGAINTLAGLGQSMLGLFTWPFDSGKMLSSGSSGVLMSLPELLFINMRKGSFKYLPYSHLSSAEVNLHNNNMEVRLQPRLTDLITKKIRKMDSTASPSRTGSAKSAKL